jgi:hypothetical protein
VVAAEREREYLLDLYVGDFEEICAVRGSRNHDIGSTIMDGLPPQVFTKGLGDRIASVLEELIDDEATELRRARSYAEAAWATYLSLGRSPTRESQLKTTLTAIAEARDALQHSGHAEAGFALDWSRGSPLLRTTTPEFYQFSYLTPPEIASVSKTAFPSRWHCGPASAAVIAFIGTWIVEASQHSEDGLFAVLMPFRKRSPGRIAG